MTQVSRYPIPKEVYGRIFEIFVKTISSLGDKKQIADFFVDFLTPTERIMLAKRLAIAFLLMKKYDYKMIARTLRVSSSTIGGVSIDLSKGSV